MFEREIRDRLASNLTIIEPNLELIDTEFPVKNSQGASGFIDILARDVATGMLVVIEIKRDDKTARAAIHELIKYIALLRQQGTLEHSLRCLVLSFSWNELLVPVSEFARMADFPVEGKNLILDDFGTISCSERITLLNRSTELRFCPEHSLFQFFDATTRAEAALAVEKALKALDVEDYVLLVLDYNHSDAIDTNFGLYLAVTVVPISYEHPKRDLIDSESWHDELAILYDAYEAARPVIFNGGSPVGFATVRAHWDVKNINRFGRWKNQLIDDEQIMNELSSSVSDNPVQCLATSNPRFSEHWNRTKKHVSTILQWNHSWNQISAAYLNELETCSDINVEFNVFEPSNIIDALYEIAVVLSDQSLTDSDAVEQAVRLKTIPYFTLLAKSKTSEKFVFGTLCWVDETPPVQPAEDSILEALGDFRRYIRANISKEQGAFNERLIESLNLNFELFETDQFAERLYRLTCSGPTGELRRTEVNARYAHSLKIYLYSHRNYFLEFKTFIERYMVPDRFGLKVWLWKN